MKARTLALVLVMSVSTVMTPPLAHAVHRGPPAVSLAEENEDDGGFPAYELEWREIDRQAQQRAVLALKAAKAREIEANAVAARAAKAAAGRLKAAERAYRANGSLINLERVVLARATAQETTRAKIPARATAYAHYVADSASIERMTNVWMWPHNARVLALRNSATPACLEAWVARAVPVSETYLAKFEETVATAKADATALLDTFRRDLGTLYADETTTRLAYERALRAYKAIPDPIRKSQSEQAKIRWEDAAWRLELELPKLSWAFKSESRKLLPVIRKRMSSLYDEAVLALFAATDTAPVECLSEY